VSRRVIVVDVESSGLSQGAAILEVAAIDMTTGRELYFVPHVHRAALMGADPEALAINRYFERRVPAEMLSECETAAKYQELMDMLGGNTLAGSNPTFDAALIRQQRAGSVVSGTFAIGEVWHHRLADLSAFAAGTLGLPLGELPGLAKVCELLDVKNEGEHSALGDARATAECFRKLMICEVRRLDIPIVRTWST
jgi:DNA polymerase III subunit epsilon